jgi:hypothetical protein
VGYREVCRTESEHFVLVLQVMLRGPIRAAISTTKVTSDSFDGQGAQRSIGWPSGVDFRPPWVRVARYHVAPLLCSWRDDCSAFR